MHFYAWQKGLKTGMYYLRTKAGVDAIKFTVDASTLKDEAVRKQAAELQILGNEDILVEQRKAELTCSLDNPEACEACGS